MGFLKDLSHWANEATSSAAPRFAANQLLVSYGKLTHFSIDHATHTISGEIMLKGEKEAVAFTISNYSLEAAGENHLLHVGSIKVSREWMQVAADEFLKNPISIPERYAKWLALIL